MPPAIIPVAAGLAGAGASAAGGKKGNKAAKNAANQQFQFQNQLFNTGMQAWQPAADYWKALLGGDPTKVAQAVGPFADIIRGQGAASSRQLAATTPAGGEANLAQTENQMGTYNQIARLSAGMQPQAAQALGQLAGMPMQLSAPNVGSGLKFDTHQQELASQQKGGLGQGLGTLIGRGASKQGKNQANPGATTSAGAAGGAKQ